jgi:hypothetical protein
MSVRAKFKVDQINPGEGYTHVVLRAVTDGSEENKTFWKYTPSGVIDMSITNPDAVNQFELGKEYYVDFTPAE